MKKKEEIYTHRERHTDKKSFSVWKNVQTTTTISCLTWITIKKEKKKTKKKKIVNRRNEKKKELKEIFLQNGFCYSFAILFLRNLFDIR